ncbi:MAG: 16S rRNA (cytidine(1402)-2'-O)-methyltransferase [Acutalibacteraceae bacterium]|nr:16S rRNA (cytidine(1402)-2'-O)-methyltransferase [Acutalibacteraceae bacterium]
MSGKLYVVGTPIGNLEDMSPRALRILGEADFIAAEDTRVTVKLLNHFDIKKEMLSYYEHNKNTKGNFIIERILKGETCALVSDAGMPAISDPGEDLVREAHKAGIAVESVPGPSALITALAISGMESGRFCFEGFLSVNKISRKKHLDELKNESRTMIFYEAPHKLNATLKDMLKVFGDRKIALVKELTKIHETVFNTTLSGAIDFYADNTPKGEFVLIIEGKKEEETELYTLQDAVMIAKKLTDEGNSTSSAAKEAAEISGIKKGDIYKELIKQ